MVENKVLSLIVRSLRWKSNCNHCVVLLGVNVIFITTMSIVGFEFYFYRDKVLGHRPFLGEVTIYFKLFSLNVVKYAVFEKQTPYKKQAPQVQNSRWVIEVLILRTVCTSLKITQALAGRTTGILITKNCECRYIDVEWNKIYGFNLMEIQNVLWQMFSPSKPEQDICLNTATWSAPRPVTC